MTVKRLLVWTLIVAVLLQPGCAWLFRSTQTVDISSNVQGATFTLDGKSIGPGKHNLELGRDYTVSASAPGYRTKTMTIQGKADVAVRFIVFDCLWMLAYGVGLLFLIVDLATSSAYDLSPRYVVLDLERAPQPAVVVAQREAEEPQGVVERRPLEEQPGPRDIPVAERVPAPPPTPPRPPTPKVAPLPGRTLVLAVGEGAGASAVRELASSGADVRLLTGAAANRLGVLRAVREHLERNVGHDDRAVLYFGGSLLRDAEGEVYLATEGADPARPEDTAVAASTLVSYLERVEGALVLVLVDAPREPDPAGAARLLAPERALFAVGDGVADSVGRGVAGAADADRDQRVSGGELSRWLERDLSGRAVVQGTDEGALPVRKR